MIGTTDHDMSSCGVLWNPVEVNSEGLQIVREVLAYMA